MKSPSPSSNSSTHQAQAPDDCGAGTMTLLFLGPEDMADHVRSILPPNWAVNLALDDGAVEQRLHDCDVILDAYMRVSFGSERLRRAANLKLFVTATTGADHIDAEILANRDIPLLTLKGQAEVLTNITPAAEHSWLLLMACARRFRSAVQGVLDGEWDRNKYPGVMLRGRTIGIIGCGRIGQWMARYATAFGMTCLGYDPFLAEWPETLSSTNLDELLETADFISIHVPLADETRGLVGPRQFERMKRGVILINTSRGEIVDEVALLEALNSGRLAAAGLDVLTGEPEIEKHPLVQYARLNSNLVLTPHIGGYSPDALRYVLAFCCQRIIDHFADST